MLCKGRLLETEGSLTGQRLPVVVLQVGLDQRGQDPLAVHHPDGGAVGEVNVALRGHSNTLGVDQSGEFGRSAIATPVLVPRETPDPASDQTSPVIFNVVRGLVVNNLHDPMSLGV